MRNSHLKKFGLSLNAADITFQFPKSSTPPTTGERQPTQMRPRVTDEVQHKIAPLKPSTAKILPPYGSKGSQAGALIEPREGRVLWSASSVEKNAMVTMLADPAVKTVREQAARISYLADDNEAHQHVLDLIVERWDGEMPALMIKPEEAAVRHDIRGLARRVAASTPRSIATRVQPFTTRHMPKWHMQNASLFLAVRRDRRTQIDEVLRELAPSLTTPVTVGDLSNHLGGGDVAFRPIARAVHYGTLEFLSRGEFDATSYVRFSGEVKPDTDADGPPIDVEVDAPPRIARSTSAEKRRAHRGTKRK